MSVRESSYYGTENESDNPQAWVIGVDKSEGFSEVNHRLPPRPTEDTPEVKKLKMRLEVAIGSLEDLRDSGHLPKDIQAVMTILIKNLKK